MKKFLIILLGFFIFSMNILFIGFRLSNLKHIHSKRQYINQRLELIAVRSAAFKVSCRFPEQGAASSSLIVDVPKNIMIAPPQILKQKLVKNIPIRLLGIVKGKSPVAFLELLDKKISGIYREGDNIGEATVCGIFSDKILLRIDGQEFELTFEKTIADKQDLPVEFIADNELLIEKKSFSKKVLDIAGEANKLKISRSVDIDTQKIKGLQVSKVPKNGFIENLGLKDDDIISRVNGMQVDSIPKALGIMNKIKSSNLIKLEIIRNNIPLMLKYQIRD
ncbi:MAG: hypothetical protein ABII88_11105 [Candidatus Omnitrophota bacterium]